MKGKHEIGLLPLYRNESIIPKIKQKEKIKEDFVETDRQRE